MNNELKIFSNPTFGDIRVSEVNGEPMFCLVDIAKALGYNRPADAVTSHCKGVSVLPTPTQNQHGATVMQNIKFGKESEIFRLVMKSKLPEAEQFQDWVCEEVLPSIRKTGGYIKTEETDLPETILAKAVLVAQKTIELQKEKLINLEAENRVNAPKVLFANAVSTSQHSCLVSELAKILNQNGINIGQNRLFQWLRDNEYLCKKGEQYNQPTQKAMELSLFELKKTSISKPDGTVLVTTTTKVTTKGQIYFINKFLSDESNL